MQLPTEVTDHLNQVQTHARRIWNTYRGLNMGQRDRLLAVIECAQRTGAAPEVLADALARMDEAADIGCHPDELEG